MPGSRHSHLDDALAWGTGTLLFALSLAIASPTRVALSVVGMLAFNLTIALNHRPGRYAVAIV